MFPQFSYKLTINSLILMSIWCATFVMRIIEARPQAHQRSLACIINQILHASPLENVSRHQCFTTPCIIFYCSEQRGLTREYCRSCATEEFDKELNTELGIAEPSGQTLLCCALFFPTVSIAHRTIVFFCCALDTFRVFLCFQFCFDRRRERLGEK